jgi:hypothetical protein
VLLIFLLWCVAAWVWFHHRQQKDLESLSRRVSARVSQLSRRVSKRASVEMKRLDDEALPAREGDASVVDPEPDEPWALNDAAAEAQACERASISSIGGAQLGHESSSDGSGWDSASSMAASGLGVQAPSVLDISDPSARASCVCQSGQSQVRQPSVIDIT